MISLSLKLLIIILVIKNIACVDLSFGSECKYSDGLYGTCTQIGSCPLILSQLQRKVLNRNDIILCNKQLRLICCPSMEDHRMEQTTISTTSKRRQTTPLATDGTSIETLHRHNQVPRISELKCTEYGKETQTVNFVVGHLEEESPRTIITSKCLHLSVPLVVGGEVANSHEFPHQALLGYNKGNPKEWLCGGSLISKQFVLTAAHCKFSEQHGIVKFVKLGVHNRNFNNNVTVTFGIEEIILHPKYDSFRQLNDISLIKLDKKVELSEYIYPICLPTKQLEAEKAIVTGFGRTSDKELSDFLMKAVVEEFVSSDCEYVFENFNASTMLCYGHHTKNQDSCEGDSGGPLQISNEDNVKCTYMQVGIVSYGSSDCGSINVPAVYVNVFHYLDWIEGIVWKNERIMS